MQATKMVIVASIVALAGVAAIPSAVASDGYVDRIEDCGATSPTCVIGLTHPEGGNEECSVIDSALQFVQEERKNAVECLQG